MKGADLVAAGEPNQRLDCVLALRTARPGSTGSVMRPTMKAPTRMTATRPDSDVSMKTTPRSVRTSSFGT
jgi:hypothetical protein